MSHKVTAFTTACPHPQSLSKFLVLIPEIPAISMMVSAADLPRETYQESAIWVGGQPVYLPVKSQVPGVWSCVVDENMALTTRLQLQLLQRNQVLRFSTGRVVVRPVDIYVMLTDESTGRIPVYTVALREAWIQAVDSVRLDWAKATEPLKWSLKFRYSICENVKPWT